MFFTVSDTKNKQTNKQTNKQNSNTYFFTIFKIPIL